MTSSHTRRTAAARAWFSLSVVTLLLGGCGGGGGGSDDAVSPVAPDSYASRCQLSAGPSNALVLPAPPGDHCIGKARFHLMDATRAEKNAPAGKASRELSLQVWYPAAAVAGGTRAAYLEPAIAPLVKAQLSLPSAAPDVLTNAKSDPVLPAGSVYPVLVFSPGYGMVAEGYSTLLEALASQGFIVVGIDHPYISGATALADGRVVQALAQPERLADTQATMAEDQRAVLDWLQGPDTGALKGHVNLALIGVAGHSIGGAAAIQMARSDARARAALDIDGTVQGDTAGPWTRPLMFLLSADHVNDATIATVLRLAIGPSRSVTLPDSGHLDFSDLKWLLNFYRPGLSSSTLAAQGLGSIDAAAALQATRRETLSFLQQWVGR